MSMGVRSTRMMGLAAGVLGLASFAGTAHGQFAAWLNEIDFDVLASEYAGAQANGSNVPVTIVESGGYPDTADGRFAGKTMTARTGVQSSTSHATIVGAMFFGNTTGFSQRSVAPAIPNVDMYTTSWEGAFFLSPGTVPPLISPNLSRVASHAYGSAGSLNTLTRMDWVVQADDFIQVVGVHSVSGHGNGFNSIAVAPTAGISGSALSGTAAVGTGTPYVAGRHRPDITGPHGTTSDSIGALGGVAALLVSRGRANAALSDYSYVARPGYTVRSAETSEVVKASIMAGALRFTSGNTVIGNITTYRDDPVNRTDNGLDNRYGAGMVNVYNSYKIIDAGEQGSSEDGDPSGGGIGRYGFDYDQSFGGAAGSNAAATYGFTAGANGKFAATLAWNLKIDGIEPTYGNFDADATLYNLDLKLLDVTAGGALVQSSASTIDNTESLWTDLIAGHTYHMQVTSAGAPFAWDYGLAWRSEVSLAPTAVPEPSAAGALVVASGLATLRRRRRR